MLVSLASAAELQRQHALEFAAPISPKLSLTLHSRFRFLPGDDQVRFGPIATYKLTSQTNLIAGYYFARTNITVHRLFAGAEHDLTRYLDTRGLLERYYSLAEPEYNRYRQRLRLQGGGSIAPYTAIEIFLDANGWRSTRYFAGLRTPSFNEAVSFDWGYFFETRRPEQGGNRHMIMTAIYFHRNGHKKDSDR